MTIAWLDDLTMELSRNDPGDEHMALMHKTVTLGCGFRGGDGIETHCQNNVHAIKKIQSTRLCMSICMYIYIYMCICICICMYVCMSVCLPVCLSVCMHACM